MGRKRSGGGRLRTSREVYDRIKWDPNLDARVFIVGYQERFSGLRERSVEALSEDVPWHRIWHFRVGELVVWNRAERVDLLFGSGQGPAEPERVHAAMTAAQAAISDRPDTLGELDELDVFRFDAERQQWVAGGAEDQAGPRSLCVVSFNVLFDLHEPAGLHTARRVAALLDRLRREKADVIALQEVTPPLVEAIVAQAWVRREFWVSDGPTAATVSPYGQLLLSRLPLRVRLRRAPDDGHKRVLYGQWSIDGRRLVVAVVHLTSDWSGDAAAVRARQLEQVCGDLASLGGTAVIVGDFNSDDDGLYAPLHARGFVDVWPALRPREPGPTLDPEHNTLARHTSRSGRVRRLDRIWVQREGALVAADIERLGLTPEARTPGGEPLYLSDHFGLRARLSVRRDDEALAPRGAPVHRTAVVVIPPRDTWAPIQAIREQHDRAHPRWMPHITLLYGFVPPHELDAAARVLEGVLSSVPALTISLERLRHFEHRRGCTVWAEPKCAEPGTLREIQAAIAAALPQCDEQSKHGPFTPHLTVGQVSRGAREQTMARWQAQWQPVEFEAHAFAVIVRRGDEPFVVHRMIPLGGGAAPRFPVLPPSVEPLVGRLRTAWHALLAARWPLWVVGSHCLGAAGPGADLDVVCVAPASRTLEQLSTELATRLQATDPTIRARPLVDAAVPRMALTIGGREIDVQIVRWPSTTAPGDEPLSLLTDAARAELDAASEHALLAAADAHALLHHAARHGGIERFSAALRLLRGWANVRRIDANALGYPGGLAWAVLLAETAVAYPADPTDADPARALFFACITSLARRTASDWMRHRSAIDRQTASHDFADPMVVRAPVAPPRNCMVRATVSTVRVVEYELERLAASVGQWSASPPLSTPIDPEAGHAWLAIVQLDADGDARTLALGIVRGQAARLVRALERSWPGTRLRPYAPGDTDGRWAMVIGVDPYAESVVPEPEPDAAPGHGWARHVMETADWPASARVTFVLRSL